MNYRKIVSFITLLLFDIITIIASYIVAYFLRTGTLSIFFKQVTTPLPFQIFISRFYLVIPFIIIFAYEGLYQKRLEFWEETRVLWKSNFIATAIIMIFLYITKGFLVSRAIVILAFVFNLLLLPLQRNLIKRILFKLHLWTKNIFIISSKKVQEQLQQQFLKHPTLGYQIALNLDTDSNMSALESPEFMDKISSRKIDGIIIDAENIESSKILEIYEHAEGKVQDFFVIPALAQLQISGVEIEQLENVLLMKYHYNLLRTESRVAKRFFDLLIAGIGLIICIPLIAIISIIIKLSSKGPVFYVQERLGKDNKRFKCYKFRTMYLDASERLENLLKSSSEAKAKWEKYYKIANDPRVTSVGRFLRRISFDELPQLWNVIKGEMSIAGPRPYLPHEVEDMEKRMVIITRVNPGITGLWQVSGRSELIFEERMRLDEYYVKNWTVWLDLVVMLKTIKVLFKAEGAY